MCSRSPCGAERQAREDLVDGQQPGLDLLDGFLVRAVQGQQVDSGPVADLAAEFRPSFVQSLGQKVVEYLAVAVIGVGAGTEVGPRPPVLEPLECGAEELLLAVGVLAPLWLAWPVSACRSGRLQRRKSGSAYGPGALVLGAQTGFLVGREEDARVASSRRRRAEVCS